MPMAPRETELGEIIKASRPGSAESVVAIDELAQAIEFASERIIPWRRKHSKRMADLELDQKALDIERTKSEISEIRMNIQGKMQEFALEQKKLELEAKRLENEKARLENEKARLELAIALIDKYAPKDLSDQDRLAYVIQLIGPLKVLAEGPLEIQNDNPK